MEGLLPIGTVVLLKNSEKRLMIAGVCQKEVGEKETIWDYAGCLYPEGYLGADKVYYLTMNRLSGYMRWDIRMKSSLLLNRR